MVTKQDVIRTIERGVEENVLNTIRALGGKKYSRKLSSRYQFDDESPDVLDQIKMACTLELGVEIEHEFMQLAGADGPKPSVVWKQDSNAGEILIKIRTLLRNSHPDSVFIVSPTLLTMLMSEKQEDSGLHRQYEENTIVTNGMLRIVGKIENRNLFVNQYASSMAPNLLCEPGWLTYSGLPRVNGQEVKFSPETFEPVTTFTTDFMPHIDPKYIKIVGIEVPYMGFI